MLSIFNNVIKCNSIDDLVKYLERTISEFEKNTNEFSDLIGEKIRVGTESLKDDPDFLEIKSKIEGGNDTKKKKTKKGTNTLWFRYDDLKIFDGLGDKGEIEIYFKSNENAKQKLEQLKKIKDSVNSLMSKGLKRDLPLLATYQSSGEFEIVFLKESGHRKKFSYKSNFFINTEAG